MHKLIAALRAELLLLFPERQVVIDGALTAVLAGEHVLLLGPPGTAKSALVRALAQAFGGRYWETLLTRFSTPEELFGPISLKGLESDRFTRITAGTLAEAEVAFCDEIFKANAAVLNALLAVCNERVFHNDGKPQPVPLVSMFGASNEMPESKDLSALWDRFALRYCVDYLLRPSNIRAILVAPEPRLTTALDMKTLRAAQVEVAKVKVTDATVDALLSIREALRQEGLVSSDRRWKKSLRLVQAAAWLSGEKGTAPEDLLILTDALWSEPKDRPRVARTVGKLADPASLQALEILDAAKESADKVAGLKAGDRKVYIAQAAQALEAFTQQMSKLQKLEKSAGRRAKEAITLATAQITSMHEELARAVSSGLGLRRAGS